MDSPKTKGRTGNELSDELDRQFDKLIDGTLAPDAATAQAHHATVRLRIALGYVEHARARGEKPNVPFFAA